MTDSLCRKSKLAGSFISCDEWLLQEDEKENLLFPQSFRTDENFKKVSTLPCVGAANRKV